MDGVHIIPFSGRPLKIDLQGINIPAGTSVRFPSSEYGFLLGQENEILEPLIQEIIDGRIAPEQQPILLYGAQGAGRTHLLKGILESWRKNQTNETVRRQAYYSTCADFARHFTESVATHTAEEFRRRYSHAKLLLLDDIEQLLGKPLAQKELRLLLDSFAADEGVVVITSQTVPDGKKSSKIEPLSEELVARIQGGTMIPLFLPGEAVRQRFLMDLASALRIPYTESALNAAAKNLIGSLPQLYGAVAQKYVEARAKGIPLDVAFWQQCFGKQKARNSQDLTEIAKRTAKYFSLKLGDLKGQSRCKTVALARSLAVYLAKTQLQITFKEIGQFFGKRDPSTVRHLFEKVHSGMQTQSELQDHIFRLETQGEYHP